MLLNRHFNTRSSGLGLTILILFVEYLGTATSADVGPTDGEEELCGMFNEIGKNDLTPIDVVVKNPDTNVACIKARFSLAIKVESIITVLPEIDDDHDEEKPQVAGNGSTTTTGNQTPKKEPEEIRVVLGYLPLDHLIHVEDSCPDWSKPKPPADNNTSAASGEKLDDMKAKSEEDEEEEKFEDLEMIVTFECGKLAFTFKRNETCDYLSSIKGVVKLDRKVMREFIAEKPMLITSDLTHHFKFDDLIEVHTNTTTKAYILSANLYFTEIETYRNTTSRDFIRPPDENSKPFPDQPPK